MAPGKIPGHPRVLARFAARLGQARPLHLSEVRGEMPGNATSTSATEDPRRGSTQSLIREKHNVGVDLQASDPRFRLAIAAGTSASQQKTEDSQLGLSSIKLQSRRVHATPT